VHVVTGLGEAYGAGQADDTRADDDDAPLLCHGGMMPGPRRGAGRSSPSAGYI
jgi:hypothetical protein